MYIDRYTCVTSFYDSKALLSCFSKKTKYTSMSLNLEKKRIVVFQCRERLRTIDPKWSDLPRTLRKGELHALGCPFFLSFNVGVITLKGDQAKQNPEYIYIRPRHPSWLITSYMQNEANVSLWWHHGLICPPAYEIYYRHIHTDHRQKSWPRNPILSSLTPTNPVY